MALTACVRCFTVEIGKRSRNLLALKRSRELYQQLPTAQLSRDGNG
ncbi:MAG TPA: hypothetical protein V6D04_09535 [Candidatus Obscuribacterales bacterium]